jgi:hypothetical protein
MAKALWAEGKGLSKKVKQYPSKLKRNLMSLRAAGEAISLSLGEIATSPFGLLAKTWCFYEECTN